MGDFLFVLLVFATLFFSVTTLILLHNRNHFKGIADFLKQPDNHSCPDYGSTSDFPLISVLIPARNEESALPVLLESLEHQDWPNLEIRILDDHSLDRTRHVAKKHEKRSHFHVKVHDGEEKPDDWLGKNWACHQLANHARGEILIFLDADTWLSPSAVRNIMESVRAYRLDFATVWPHQIMETAVEKAVISTVYSTIALYLPARYSYRAPRWIPSRRLRDKVKPMFASACGQCMIFTKDAYHCSGGHAAVKDQVVEDVMLAKRIVSAGKTMRMFHGTGHLWCRMYRSGSEVYHGFRKNFFAGFGYRFLPFMSAWALHIATYLLPPVILVLTAGGLLPCPVSHLFLILLLICVLVPFFQRLWVSKFLKWPVSTAFFYLAGILWFQMLAVVVIRDRILRTRTVWKGRAL